MTYRLLCLALVLCFVRAQDDSSQFPHSLARVGQICPSPDDDSQAFVCHFSGGEIVKKAVDKEAVNPLLTSGDSLPGHFATDGNLYDCDCVLVDPNEFPCTTDDCCASSPLVNNDVGAHVDSTCPTNVGDSSVVGCVEFTGCRYDILPCTTNECCENSPLRNPDLDVEFNEDCPQENGEPSHGGCIEFTRCKYVDFTCDSDECCSTDDRVHANSEFSIHFDEDCPTKDGAASKVGCIAFTGCMYGEDDALVCEDDDDCCRELSVTNHDPTLGVHVDANCPVKETDPSLVGCVEFTGCRYNVDNCDDDACCENNALRNPQLPVQFNSDCPAHDGQESIVGCIEFTQCQYVEEFTDNVPCTDDVCCVNNPAVPQNGNVGVHFDPECPVVLGDDQHNGCVGFTGCRTGTVDACDDDLCCSELNLIVNHDPALGVHFDEDCPKEDGDTSLVGCVEFTGCRYQNVVCDDTECCEENPLRNPDLPVVFNSDCPQVDGDPSIIGCIEFTRCQYLTKAQKNSVGCTNDDCCRDNPEVNHNPLLGVHFDEACPTADGEDSHGECVGLTGCRYGAIQACETDECCQNVPVVNRDPDLGIHFDESCPTEETDSSLVGCVQFTGCRYGDITEACETNECCAELSIRNQDLPVVFSDECPVHNGDLSVIGCIEFTRCKYTDTIPDTLSCFVERSDDCCEDNAIVNHDPTLIVHFDETCPQANGDTSIIGCVEFTGCKYETPGSCDTENAQECCESSPIVNHDPSLNVIFDSDCPLVETDTSLVGCVEFTQCRYETVTACTNDECCQKNTLRNPEIPVVFDENCPAVNGEDSLIGCIEFTQCKYTDELPASDGPCGDDACCAVNILVNQDPLLAVHFDSDCPTEDGDESVIGCVEFTGCRYGNSDTCETDECCRESTITNHDPSLNVHADSTCPREDGDVSLIGCVEFTGCRYDVEQCENDECCAKNALRNPSLPVVFNSGCPQVDGDPSIVGCIEFTQCQYIDTIVPEQVCTDDFCCATTTNIPATSGVHFDAHCPTEENQPTSVGCIGFTGCSVGASPACTDEDDDCCAQNPIVNQDPSLDAHFDGDCPTEVGDDSLVGCVEFTGCRYSDVACQSDECCEKNALRNPDLPAVFDAACPLKNGDDSIVGCIEFTQCRYAVVEQPSDDVQCTDDFCCVSEIGIESASTLGVHFDGDCPTQEGDLSVVGCVGFSGCRHGADFDNPCQSDECCKAHPLVNQDETLNNHFDANCPVEATDASLVGCVEFSGCRYGDADGPCETDPCCEESPIINHDISLVGAIHADENCPRKDGDLSIIGCVEFTGCKYDSTAASCTDDACCDGNPLVNHDPSLGAHFDSTCPETEGDTSVVGCVEFTRCRYFTMVCNTDDCCTANPLVQPDDDLAIHFDADCPKAAGDPVVQGCVDFTRCRFGDKTFIDDRNALRAASVDDLPGDETETTTSGLGAGDVAAILLAVVLFATLMGAGYYCFCRKTKNDRDYIAMDNRSDLAA